MEHKGFNRRSTGLVVGLLAASIVTAERCPRTPPTGALAWAAGAAEDEGLQREAPKKCRLPGVPAEADDQAVCLPEPSSDLLRLGLAFEISRFSGRPYTQVVEEARKLFASFDAWPTVTAPGEFPIEIVPLQLASVNVVAPPQAILSEVKIANQDPSGELLALASFGDGFTVRIVPPLGGIPLADLGESLALILAGDVSAPAVVSASVQAAPPPAMPTCRLRRAIGFVPARCIGRCVDPPNCVGLAFTGVIFREPTVCGCR